MRKTSVIVTLVVVLSVLSAFAYIPIILPVATSVSTIEVEPIAVQEMKGIITQQLVTAH